MKIAYLIHWNEGAESGVLKKVVHQLAEWRQQGHEPALFLFTCRPNEDWGRLCAEAGIPVITQIYKGTSGRMADFGLLAKKIRKWQPEVLYHRFDLYYLSLPGLLRAFPSVLEVNTHDMAELRMEQGFRYYYHSFTRGKVLSAAGGHVYVSHELSQSRHYQPYAKASIVIGNGIRLADFEEPILSPQAPVPADVRQTAPAFQAESPRAEAESVQLGGESHNERQAEGADQADGGEHDGLEAVGEENLTPPDSTRSAPRLVFIGSAGQSWHGLDHIAELAALKPEWRFDIIGIEAEELNASTTTFSTVYSSTKTPSSSNDSFSIAADVHASLPGSGPGPSHLMAPENNRADEINAVPMRGTGAVLVAEKGAEPATFAALVNHTRRSEAAAELPPNVFFHGKMTRSAYQPLLDQADIAIGTLALYRKDMKEASPLKVREYLANGLPVIIGYEDTDFPAGAPFLLNLPASPDNIRNHLSEIEQFVEGWKGCRITRESVSHLDTRFKEAERLRFMEQIAAGRVQGNGRRP